MDLLQLNFLHHATSDIYTADCDPACLGQDAINGLIKADFIEHNPRGGYDMTNSRTQTQILPDQTLAAAGVQNGDSIALHRRGQGAC